ncbi:pathogen-associated molecular patterns-induced protein A70-like [Humulus lupulus]|uniref:pathogen-associated molecular patterns-induced protein A70-like n=1 Tax=Humulus lupulus TaxID=3486 RepID=UPI002B409BE7|nr:pathogen-associated molecular patterns-induced protein A70-like [Humulus lupulus]
MFEDSVFSIATIWASMNSWLTPTVLFLLLNLVIATIFITSTLTSPDQNQNQNNHHQQQRLHPQLVRSLSVLKKLKSFNFNTYRAQEPTTHLQKSPAESDEHFEQPQAQQQQEPHLARSPSMLQRLISINFYHHLAPAKSQNQNLGNPEPTTTRFDSEQEQNQHIEWSDSESEEEEETRDQFEDEVHHDVHSQLKTGGGGGGGHVARTSSDTKPSNGEAPPKLSRKLKKSASAKSAFGHFKEDDIVGIRRPETVREGKAKEAKAKTEEEFDAKADDFITKFKEELKLQRLESVTRYKEMIGRGAAQ